MSIILQVRKSNVLIQYCRGVSTRISDRKQDRDVFGTLSRRGRNSLDVLATETELPDDPDGYDKEEYDLSPRKSPYFYKYEIPKYARQGKIELHKALELFQTMKQHDRLTPDRDSFLPLIYGCSRAGYTKKAFELYQEYLKYIPKPSQSLVTCLVNSCAESPFPEYGLKRLDWLMEHLKVEHSYQMNRIQYQCSIKAYGKLGKLGEASRLVTEMISNGMQPDTSTFNMLLIGCASNKEAGATLALRTYKRMKQYEIQPDTVTYQLMLRCIGNCGMGSARLIKETLAELPAITSHEQRLKYKTLKRGNKSKKFEWLPLITDLGDSISSAVEPENNESESSEVKLLGDGKSGSESEFIIISRDSDQSQLVTSSNSPTSDLPNLLSDDHLDLMYRVEAIRFDGLHLAPNRFLLFGGMRGYLETMIRDGCQPNPKVFSLMLPCIWPNAPDHMEYSELSKKYSIQRDLIFYDLLIRHVGCAFRDRNRMERVKYWLEEMQKDGIRPNISTLESVALSCDNLRQAEQLIKDVESCGFVMSDIIIYRLFMSAIRKSDYYFINGLIDISIERKYKPSKKLVDMLEEKRLEVYGIIRDHEKGILTNRPVWLTDTQIGKFDRFSRKFSLWLRNVDLYEEDHPWKQFHIEDGSRKRGFHDFVQGFKTLTRAKNEILRRNGKFGNLMADIESTKERESKASQQEID